MKLASQLTTGHWPLATLLATFALTAPQLQTFTPDGAWCWFADPRAVYYEGQHKRTYVGWVNRAGDIQVGAYDQDGGKMTTATLHPALQPDDHANPALLVRPDGRLMVFYSAHNGKAMFYRTTERAEDISTWSEESTIRTNIPGSSGYTYPNPIQLSDEGNRIYLFWRGGSWKPTVSFSENGSDWSGARVLIEGSGARPYVKVASNGRDKIHFAFTDGHPRNEPANSIYHAVYFRGALFRADGTRIKDWKDLPIAPSDADKVYDGAANRARAWIWDIALDASGNPAIVYSALPAETDHRYRYARWTGARWLDHEISRAGGWFPKTPAGEKEREQHYSGGVVLDHANPAVVYLSHPVGGVFEIEKWTTADGGATWKSEPITSGSKENNVRPVVPRGSRARTIELFWMAGDYIHYTNYATALRMKLN